jgi:effector-binding domain-containing protein
MICVPDYLDDQLLQLAMMDSIGHVDHSIHLKTIPGGMFAQILHEGTYDDIIHTKAKLDEEIMANGYVSKGTCTEINLAPMFHNNQCKIIIRQRIETI